VHAKNHYQWNCGQAYIETNIQSSFRSKSLQRPSSKSYVPGAGTYTPNIHAVKAAPSHSGGVMRSRTDRFRPAFSEKPMTARHVGPGVYEAHNNTLLDHAQKLAARNSKANVGFGSTSSQRGLPFHPLSTPGPGEHQPHPDAKRRGGRPERIARKAALDSRPSTSV
jgi:hypothetical protein